MDPFYYVPIAGVVIGILLIIYGQVARANTWFIPDWRQAWRFLSVQLAAGIALLAAAYDYLPVVRENLPEGWVKWAALLLIAARILNQKTPGNAT